MMKHSEALVYGSGIALVDAKKSAKLKQDNARQTNKIIPREKRQCKYYHPSGCTHLDHSDVKSKVCFVNGLSIAKRKVLLGVIFKESVDKEGGIIKGGGKYIRKACHYCVYHVCITSTQLISKFLLIYAQSGDLSGNKRT